MTTRQFGRITEDGPVTPPSGHIGRLSQSARTEIPDVAAIACFHPSTEDVTTYGDAGNDLRRLVCTDCCAEWTEDAR